MGARTSSAFPAWTRSDQFATLSQITAHEKRPNRSTRATAKRIYRFYTEEGFAAYSLNDIRWTWRQGQNLQSVTYPNSVAHSYDTRNRLTSLAVALSCTDVPKIAVEIDG